MHKWYMKLFRKLLNATVLKAMIIYRHNTGKQISQLAFRANLVEGLSKQVCQYCKKSSRSPAGRKHYSATERRPFHPQSSSWEKINTADEQHDMHQTWLSTV
jgi:hypothetical protein